MKVNPIRFRQAVEASGFSNHDIAKWAKTYIGTITMFLNGSPCHRTIFTIGSIADVLQVPIGYIYPEYFMDEKIVEYLEYYAKKPSVEFNYCQICNKKKITEDRCCMIYNGRRILDQIDSARVRLYKLENITNERSWRWEDRATQTKVLLDIEKCRSEIEALKKKLEGVYVR